MNPLRASLLFVATLAAAPTLATISCTLTPSVSPLAFGTYTVLAQSTANVTYTYTCTRNLAGDSTAVEPWRIRLDTGSTSGAGGYANRTLFNGVNIMLYNIYTEAAFTNIWGDTTGGSVQVTGSFNFAAVPVGGSLTTTVTGFGRVAANQDLNAGLYATTTVITATARLATGPPVLTTSTLSVNANLAANCQIDTTPSFAFGVYDPLAVGDVDLSLSLITRCTKTSAYTISMNTGGGGGFSPRKMDSAGANTDQLNYNLYTPAGFSVIWGDGTGGTSTVSSTGAGMLAGVAVTRTINGRLFAGQNVSADSYADTVTLTISY